jgi:hypothetical protein
MSSRLACRRAALYQPMYSTTASSSCERAPDAVGDQLGLEAVDERLGERVVVGVAHRSDRPITR